MVCHGSASFVLFWQSRWVKACCVELWSGLVVLGSYGALCHGMLSRDRLSLGKAVEASCGRLRLAMFVFGSQVVLRSVLLR